ncbi:MAG: Uma2 family endonuclease [Saprospiraceae bacterium]|nr:Uma2 family endonuclease [Saprospiraceae bacterium]
MSTATAAILSPAVTPVAKQSPAPSKAVTLEAYFKKYRDLEDGFKYELVNGNVEKTHRTMTPAQSFILRNLHHRFVQTKAYAEGGDLQVEIEMLTKPDQIRKPDICYRSAKQIVDGDFSPSEFVVELISPNDKIEKVKDKLREYFAAGVKVVWHIFPVQQEIEVYTSARRSDVFSGADMVSAAPVIPDFNMKADEVFQKIAISTQ